MRHARKYVVGWKDAGWVSETRETWTDAQSAVSHFDNIPNATVEVYALVPVAAWKCVESKDGTRRMVKVRAKKEAGLSVTRDGKGGA